MSNEAIYIQSHPQRNPEKRRRWRVWLWRVLLLVVLPALFYAALHPGFAGWQVVPHGFLYRHGVPYAAVLWFEMHFGEIFHFLMAWLLALLLPAARLLGQRSRTMQRAFWFIVLLLAAPAVEWWQWSSGRGIDPSDLFYHYLGMVMAVACWIVMSALAKSDY